MSAQMTDTPPLALEGENHDVDGLHLSHVPLPAPEGNP